MISSDTNLNKQHFAVNQDDRLTNGDNCTLSHMQLCKLWWCRILADAHA